MDFLTLFSPLVIGVMAILGVIFLMSQGRKVLLRCCILFFGIAFVGGITLYSVGYIPPNPTLSDIIEAMLHGLFSTGRMFALEEDFGYLADVFRSQGWFYTLAFWFCHVLALIVSISAAVALLGKRIIDWVRLTMRRNGMRYILCGIDERTLTLGRNIATRDGRLRRPDPNRLVLFLTDEVNGESSQAVAAFGGIVMEKRRLSRILARGRGDIRLIVTPPDEVEVSTLIEEALAVSPEHTEILALSESDWVREQMVYLAENSSLPLHVTGEAELAARQMILRLPPWSLPGFEEDFTILVLGLGRTGEAALRRLMMNGQCPGRRLNMVLVDREMEAIRGRLTHRYPGFPLIAGMEYHTLDVRSEGFYALLDEWFGRIGYVVIALDSDDANLDVLHSIGTYYERAGIPRPPIAVALRESGMPERKGDRTVFFSQRGDIYTESMVIHEELDYQAKVINGVHTPDTGGHPSSIDTLWRSTPAFNRESSRAAADFIPGILALAKKDARVSREELEKDAPLLERLAQAEHLRWCAFLYASGYLPMGIEEVVDSRKDDLRKRHICLVDWEELDALSAAYNALGIDVPRDFAQNDRDSVLHIPRYLSGKNGRT